MGCGKTIISQKLAEQLNLYFLDTDQYIIKKEKRSINNIFKTKGEKYFREIERETLKTIKKNSIISCGGGLPIYKDNMNYINNNGTSIYLKCSTSILYKRLKNDKKNRPLIKNISNENLKDFINKHLLEREKIYKKAKHIVDIEERNIENILREINSLIRTV